MKHMLVKLITALLFLFGSTCALYAINPLISDVTPGAPVINTGKLFLIQDSVVVEHVGNIDCSRLFYTLGSTRIYPIRDLRAVEAIFKCEGFKWGDERQIQGKLIPSFILLYSGWNYSSYQILSSFYYVSNRDDPVKDDQETFARLKKTYPNPIVSVVGEKWSITLYVIQEQAGVCPIDKYIIEGTTAPFHIQKCTIEDAGSVVIKNPAPTG